MQSHIWPAAAFALLALCTSDPALAQLNGEPYIHDPSTVVLSDGKYYTFGTGGGGLTSDDGWTWHSGAVRPGGGLAPDVIKIGDRFFVAYASKGGGLAGGHAGAINTMWTRTLDPQSPDFGFHDDSVVASTDGVEDADAIDPSFLYAEGHLWLTYGTYFGFIRIVELDPRTAKRVAGNQPVDIAIDMEATDMLYRDGWYYLLGTHGTCCDGPNSTYNIRVGRARAVTGPFVDNLGIPLLKGGGKLVVAASGRQIGPGHFGLLDLGDGVEKFSCHYEADMDRGGRSVLDIRPLLWENGWPVAGDNFRGGTYEIQSERSGGALELAVDFVRITGGRRGGFGRQAGPAPPPAPPIPDQTLAQDSATWPAGNIDVDLGDYMVRPHQAWTITPMPDAGGYPGSPYFTITIAGTDRALAATADGEVVTVPASTGGPAGLWRIDQLTDGTFRIMPKSMPGSQEPVALTALGASTPALTRFDPNSDKARWNFRRP
jgi:arabinan endo-1,5-alpha-L-arabinosidase